MTENEVTVLRSAPSMVLTTATEAATGHNTPISTPSAMISLTLRTLSKA